MRLKHRLLSVNVLVDRVFLLLNRREGVLRFSRHDVLHRIVLAERPLIDRLDENLLVDALSNLVETGDLDDFAWQKARLLDYLRYERWQDLVDHHVVKAFVVVALHLRRNEDVNIRLAFQHLETSYEVDVSIDELLLVPLL